MTMGQIIWFMQVVGVDEKKKNCGHMFFILYRDPHTYCKTLKTLNFIFYSSIYGTSLEFAQKHENQEFWRPNWEFSKFNVNCSNLFLETFHSIYLSVIKNCDATPHFNMGVSWKRPGILDHPRSWNAVLPYAHLFCPMGAICFSFSNVWLQMCIFIGCIFFHPTLLQRNLKVYYY